MPLNFNLNLPGPFSYSKSISPGRDLRRAGRSAARAHREFKKAQRPNSAGSGAGVALVWCLVLGVLLVLVVGAIHG